MRNVVHDDTQPGRIITWTFSVLKIQGSIIFAVIEPGCRYRESSIEGSVGAWYVLR